MHWYAFGTYLTGSIGMMIGSKCERGWHTWVRWQRITCTVSAAVALTGLVLMDAPWP
ncbi:hypothetical protein ACIRBX_12200 [Kitasatospora sp. NPDC096147]|uniref:hypothetical protein n=1 Tax=Kitasatospora sp. NPDC096147 TaxID=3364093 RepID=UPI003804B813